MPQKPKKSKVNKQPDVYEGRTPTRHNQLEGRVVNRPRKFKYNTRENTK